MFTKNFLLGNVFLFKKKKGHFCLKCNRSFEQMIETSKISSCLSVICPKKQNDVRISIFIKLDKKVQNSKIFEITNCENGKLVSAFWNIQFLNLDEITCF